MERWKRKYEYASNGISPRSTRKTDVDELARLTFALSDEMQERVKKACHSRNLRIKRTFTRTARRPTVKRSEQNLLTVPVLLGTRPWPRRVRDRCGIRKRYLCPLFTCNFSDLKAPNGTESCTKYKTRHLSEPFLKTKDIIIFYFLFFSQSAQAPLQPCHC